MKKLNLPEWLKPNRHDQRVFCALTILFGIYVLPIILTDRYYQDDLSRSLRGITGWNNDARPLTEWIMKWLCGGTPISDIAPLPLLLSVLILAYTLTIYFHRNLPQIHSVGTLSCIGFLVVANPFFLSNLSYRYDCIAMVLALCAAMAPYVLPEQLSGGKVLVFSFLMCMIVFTTYQPCCGVHIALCCLELFFMILSARINWIRLGIRVISLGVSALLYYFVIMERYIADSSWQQSAYRFSSGGDITLLDAVQQNFERFIYFLQLYASGVPNPVIGLFMLIILGGMTVSAAVVYHSCGRFKILGALYAILLPLLVIVGSILPLLILTPSNFSISAHTLIALCSFGLWSGIMVSFLIGKTGRIAIVPLIPCLLFLMGFSYVYGNASKSQKQYEEYLTYQIVHDIETLNGEGQYTRITIDGRAGCSRETAMLIEKYPVFQTMIPTYLTNNSYLGGAQLLHYMQDDLEFSSLSEEENVLIEENEPLLSNAIYDCHIIEDKIVIRFN